MVFKVGEKVRVTHSRLVDKNKVCVVLEVRPKNWYLIGVNSMDWVHDYKWELLYNECELERCPQSVLELWLCSK